MPAGLQAWDASGNLVVDLGDYTVKFVGRYTINIATNSDIGSITVNGINGNNYFASVMKTTGMIDDTIDTNLLAKTRTNGIDLIFLPGRASGGKTAEVELYMFV